MKRIFITLIAIAAASVNMMAMSSSKIKKETLFLTDKMAYELQLSDAQYNDAYEINYDFIYNIRNIMDDVIEGDDDALEEYYNFLDTRNDDLRWVLNDRQYKRFLAIEYFYRPIVATGGSWSFRVYNIYPNRTTFYFDRPSHYNTYCGGHYRTYNNNISFYTNRYNHTIFRGQYQTRNVNVYVNNRRSDFGINSSVNNNGRSDSRRGYDDMYNVRRSSGSYNNGTGTNRSSSYSNSRSTSTTPNTYQRSSSESTSRRSYNNTPSSTYTRPSATTPATTTSPTRSSSSTYERRSNNVSERTSTSTPESTSRSTESTKRSESRTRR